MCNAHHYSNAHNGVCLVFDIKKLDMSFKKQVNKKNLISGSVIYSDDGIVPDLSKHPFTVNLIGINSEKELLAYLSNHLDQWLPNLFLKKLMDWSNEEEYRWVYFDNNPEPICLTFDDALEAIVIGEGVSKDYYEELLMYCAKYEAGFAHLQWRNGYPALGQIG